MRVSLLQWTCFSLIAGQTDVAKSISVKKCCQPGEALTLSDVLDESKVQNPSCVKHDGKFFNYKKISPDIILDKIWNDIQAFDKETETLVNASLHLQEFHKIPNCVKGFEIHKLDAGKSDRATDSHIDSHYL